MIIEATTPQLLREKLWEANKHLCERHFGGSFSFSWSDIKIYTIYVSINSPDASLSFHDFLNNTTDIKESEIYNASFLYHGKAIATYFYTYEDGMHCMVNDLKLTKNMQDNKLIVGGFFAKIKIIYEDRHNYDNMSTREYFRLISL